VAIVAKSAVFMPGRYIQIARLLLSGKRQENGRTVEN
jgi:hypothetical protein